MIDGRGIFVRLGLIAGATLLMVSCAEIPTEPPASGPAPVRGVSHPRDQFTREEIEAYEKLSKHLTPEERGKYLTLPTREARRRFLRKRGLIQ